MNVKLAAILWLGDSRDVIRSWPVKAKQRAGEELFRLQIGSEPLHWRVMKSVGRGVREIKISASGQYRVFYVARKKEGFVVLHAFEKKTKRTTKFDIELGQQRLKMI